MRARLQHDRRFSIFACAVFVCATLASIFSPAFAITTAGDATATATINVATYSTTIARRRRRRLDRRH